MAVRWRYSLSAVDAYRAAFLCIGLAVGSPKAPFAGKEGRLLCHGDSYGTGSLDPIVGTVGEHSASLKRAGMLWWHRAERCWGCMRLPRNDSLGTVFLMRLMRTMLDFFRVIQ